MSIEARFRVEWRSFTLDVDLRLPVQGVTVIYGPSGCGKTTILRAIAGLDHHPNGFLKIGETVWQEAGLFVPAHKRQLGYVFQEASLFPHLTVERNIEYGVRRTPAKQQTISLERVSELLGIQELLGRRPANLSGGERQRVAIARALAVSPRLLLMDEPLASLDIERKQEILPYIESLTRELDIPILYVTHSPEEVARLADHMVLLDAGRVQASGGIAEMLTRLDTPLVHRDDAGAVIDAIVVEYDEDFHLMYLEFDGGKFTVVRKELSIGSRVRLRVAARDISITLEPQKGTSILNIFPAVIDEIIPEGTARMIIRLRIGGTPVLARVTRKSAALLDLRPGKKVFAQVKSVALL